MFFEIILQKEFPFITKMNPTMIVHTLSIMYGASNTFLLDNIETIGALMTDNVIGNRLTLNAPYGALSGLFKSKMYNNIISILKDKIG